MRIFYFSTALSDDIYNEIVKKSKSFKPTFSGVGFDRNVAVGLSEYADVYGVSYYPIPSYPKYDSVTQQSKQFTHKDFKCVVPGMLDLPLLKEYSYCFKAKKLIHRKLSLSEKDNVIVISGLYRCFLRPAKYLKKKYGVKIYAIVPDLPELMATYRQDYSSIRRLLNQIDVKRSQEYRDCVDGFVFLSKHMNEHVNKQNKPMIVVDGLTDIASFPESNRDSNERIVLYAGKVSSTFGVDKLVEAFLKANFDKTTKLYICGDGDYAPELKKIAKINESIQYLGSVPHEKVLELEVQATLLVDPRPSDMEIVKMSFPSKIIEYMASGTPVLTTNLPCFAEEYKQYQFRIEDESVDGIVQALKNVFLIDSVELINKGIEARKFILEYKTIYKQCGKIMNFITSLEKMK